MSDEQSQTERLAAWAAEHGLEIAKVQVPPALDISKMFLVDEVNFIPKEGYDAFYPRTAITRSGKKSKLSILKTRLKWKLTVFQSRYEDFVFKARNRWKLPEGWCCWDMNVCYDVECETCEYSYWACAYCGHKDPCAKCNN